MRSLMSIFWSTRQSCMRQSRRSSRERVSAVARFSDQLLQRGPNNPFSYAEWGLLRGDHVIEPLTSASRTLRLGVVAVSMAAVGTAAGPVATMCASARNGRKLVTEYVVHYLPRSFFFTVVLPLCLGLARICLSLVRILCQLLRLLPFTHVVLCSNRSSCLWCCLGAGVVVSVGWLCLGGQWRQGQ